MAKFSELPAGCLNSTDGDVYAESPTHLHIFHVKIVAFQQVPEYQNFLLTIQNNYFRASNVRLSSVI